MVPTQLEIAEYALEGLSTLIGVHSGNPDAAEDLVLCKEHQRDIEAAVAVLRALAEQQG